MFSEVFSSLLFGVTTDLTDHHDTLGLWVVEEDFEAIDEVGAVEWITTNTNAEGLAESSLGGLVDSFVSEGSGSRDDTDLSSLVDVTGHDTDLTLLGGDDAGAVGADKSGLVLLDQCGFDSDHILGRNTFSDADGEGNFGFDGIEDGVGSELGWDVDDGSVGTSSLKRQITTVLTDDDDTFLASATELKTGTPRCSWPPLPGVTPPTTCVP